MLKNAVWNIASDTALAVKRFPLPALFCLLFCLCSILGYDKEGTYLAILFCGCFWLIGLQLFAESHAWRPLPFYALGLTIFAGMAWHLSTAPQLSIPLAFLGAGLFLGMFIAPFIGKRATGAEIWRFNYRLCLRIGFTLLAAIVLYLGLAGILTSLDFLFGLTFMDDMYGDAWLIVATFFSPLLAMAGIPTRFDTVEESYPKAMKLVLSCIAVPLLLVYAAILYSYAAKILITWELPKGGVAYLVTAFGGAGMMAYLASYPLHREPGVLRVFGRWFFPILLVPLALFAVAIGVRIHAYGVTEERYAILLCFFWLPPECSFFCGSNFGVIYLYFYYLI